MNYLAHLYLADATSTSFLGSLMGDFVKGSLDQSLPKNLRVGIIQHRRIDTFTDAHPIVKRSKERISPTFRRYAGILMDVFYDHFLATQWHRFQDQSLDDFTSHVYAHLEQHPHRVPDTMRRTLAYMLQNDLLGSYRTLDGIQGALRGIEGRLKRPSHLGQAMAELEANHDAMLSDFMAFFPELIVFVTNDQVAPPSG